MDVDTPSSSPSSTRLSVLYSGSADYSGSTSEASSPSSRRGSMSESMLKGEQYWDKKRKNNGENTRKTRDRKRSTDASIEQRLLQLSQENQLLKSQLESRTAAESLLSTGRPVDYPALPSASQTVYESAPKIQALYPNPLQSLMIPSSNGQLPMFQLCHLQAALQQQYNNAAGPSLFPLNSALPAQSLTASSASLPGPSTVPLSFAASSATSTPVLSSSSVGTSSSAFQPFQHKESVIKSTFDRKSPDSSSDTNNARNQVSSSSTVSDRPSSLLGALLANRRPSPTVPQSSTEHRSGLATPPLPPQPSASHLEELKCAVPSAHLSMTSSSAGSSKSDSESHSSASLSPSELMEMKEGGDLEGRKQQYMDRRRRNNEAAKRCRANRRAIFEYRSRRVQVLEGENDDLKREIAQLKGDIEQFKAMIAAQSQQENQ